MAESEVVKCGSLSGVIISKRWSGELNFTGKISYLTSVISKLETDN